MKTLGKVFVTVILVVVGLVTVIKVIQKCSWKEAVGIFEEFLNEICESCRCCRHDTGEDEVTEGA